MEKSPSFSSIPPARPSSVPARSSSVPALSKAAKSSQTLWWRLGQLASGAGLFLTIGHVVLSRSLHHQSAPWQADALSGIFLSAFLALFLMSIASVGWAGVSLMRLRAAVAIRLVASCVALGFSGFILSWAVGASFFLLSGSPLTLGSVEFFVSGLRHLGVSTLQQYSFQSLVCLTLAMMGFWLVYRVTAKVLRETSPCPLASLPRMSLSLFGLVALLAIFSRPDFALQTSLNRSPELAFLASVAKRSEQPMVESIKMQGQGAPVQEGAAWDQWAELKKKGASSQIAKSPLAQPEHAPADLSPQPHSIVLIQLESVGINHLGFMGDARRAQSVTPHLDRIAKKSLVFERARTTATHSNYAQMATLSSLFPRRYSGLDTYGRLDYPRFLLHDALHALGAKTGTISSQDETWQGMSLFQTTDTPTHFEHSGNTEGEKLDMITEKITPDSVTRERALDWVDEQSGPFSLYLNFQSTHFPYKIPKQAPRPYQPAEPDSGHFNYFGYPRTDLGAALNRYDNALRYVDAQVGALYDGLATRGLLESTIFVLTADHGELFYEHEMVTHGRTLYEEEVRVPLLFHAPQRLSPERRTEQVSTLDILPTILSLLQAPAHPALQGQALVRPTPGGHFEVSVNQERGIFMNIQGMKSQEALICGDYKLVHDQSGGTWRLYNLSSPEAESVDIREKEIPRFRQMKQVLQAQIRAQERYYSTDDSAERQAYYAPRMANCPDLSQPVRGRDISLAQAH